LAGLSRVVCSEKGDHRGGGTPRNVDQGLAGVEHQQLENKEYDNAGVGGSSKLLVPLQLVLVQRPALLVLVLQGVTGKMVGGHQGKGLLKSHGPADNVQSTGKVVYSLLGWSHRLLQIDEQRSDVRATLGQHSQPCLWRRQRRDLGGVRHLGLLERPRHEQRRDLSTTALEEEALQCDGLGAGQFEGPCALEEQVERPLGSSEWPLDGRRRSFVSGDEDAVRSFFKCR